MSRKMWCGQKLQTIHCCWIMKGKLGNAESWRWRSELKPGLGWLGLYPPDSWETIRFLNEKGRVMCSDLGFRNAILGAVWYLEWISSR